MKCYGCEGRHPGCHGECEYYINWKRERDKMNAERNLQTSIDADRIRAMIHTIEKTRKGRR